MKKLIINIFIFLMILPLLSFANSSLNQSVNHVMQQARDKFELPGLAVSINLPNGKVESFTSGYQTIEKSHKLNPKMLFQVGSITKTFTSVLMLKLQSRGKLNLDDKLGQFLPQYPKWKNITLRQLLNQTSGVYDYIDLPNWFPMLAKEKDKVWSLSELANLSYKHKSSFSVGQGWQYSNTNYVLAGMVIEKVTGKSIKSLMNSMIITPYDLNHTFFEITNYTPIVKEKIANGYYFSPKDKPLNMSFENTSWLGSAGGITSNPHDIAIWTGDLFRKKALSDSQLSQFTQVVSPFTGKPEHELSKPGYGLGVFRMNTPVGLIWFTPGLTSGYRSMLSYMPCKNIAITYTMTSSDMYHHGSAKFLLMNLYQTILKNKQVVKLVQQYETTHGQPEYCSSLAKDKKFLGLGAFFKH